MFRVLTSQPRDFAPSLQVTNLPSPPPLNIGGSMRHDGFSSPRFATALQCVHHRKVLW